MYSPKQLLSKEDLERELFNAYFKVLNRVNILIELNTDIEDCKVHQNALLIMREQLEMVKSEYYERKEGNLE